MSAERDQMIKTLREEAIKDTEQFATKQRFALFSQPPPLGIGDDSYDRKKLPAPRDETTKKPITEQPNIKVKAPRQGKVASSYFSQLGFTTIGDKYIDPDRQQRLYELKKMQEIKNDAIFKPASGYKEIITAPYEHHSDLDPKAQKKNYRGEDHKVITANKNVTTNPYCKTLLKHPEFKPDEYARARQKEIDDWKKSKSLMREAPFKTTVAGGNPFGKDKDTFGMEFTPPKASAPKSPKLNILKQEQQFRPANPGKKGIQGTIGKYPEYKGDPIKPLTRIDKTKTKDPFKPNHGGNLTRPTPTVSCFPQNIRREMASKGF